ncbi:xyloglucan galactosyltransferase KATAMARI1 homolog [Camellia sinensis]|uniref:xyloglucan galactosyltransferase KATAMARI1 homolog n=1 Tax=Camellia sinensis TaxID=4442 RepID=UPI001035F4D5|nr:xyloglucan galactosyltransferase KATAMARI1 homolog [Camellia sinensis]
MIHRRLFWPRARRQKMENSVTIRCRNHLWLVVFVMFVLWYLLLYVPDWSSLRLTSLPQNHVNFIESQHSNPNQNPNHVGDTNHHSISTTISDDDRVKPENEIGTETKNRKIKPIKPSAEKEGIENIDRVSENREKPTSDIVDHRGEKPEDGSRAAAKPPERIEKVDQTPVSENREEPASENPELQACSGRYIYIHDIPKRFNDELIENCKSLSNWSNMCQYMENMGLGQRLPTDKVFSNTGWFATNQFSLEVIFHNRMKQYKCLTKDSTKASAIFIPYYAGLDVARYLWGSSASARDSGSIDVYKWVREQPEWKTLYGRDHFLVAGRITWDFRRGVDDDSAWGNRLMLLPESKNITMLTIESSPWNSNDFAIPYPTYFHPSKDSEVFQWQNKMRRLRRRFLFSFAGAPRPNMEDSIRSQIMQQCQATRRKCKLLECQNKGNKCMKPAYLMKMFQSSVFCLQPPGDSFTRRSTFDSIVAGCIPVFFHPASAYIQYLWHLPKNYNKYSVMIPEDDVKNNNVSIERELMKIPNAKVAAMREEVIKLIPKVIYTDPRSRLETVEDAFDLTVKGVLERVERLRREIEEGRNSSVGFHEEFSWKYSFFGTLDNREWDHFFKRRDRDRY